MVTQCLTFQEIVKLFFSKWLHYFIIPPARYKGSDFSTSWPTLNIYLFYCSHPSRCELASYCGFDLHTLIITMSSIFPYAYFPFVCPFYLRKRLFKSFTHFLNWLFVFILLSFNSFLTYYGYKSHLRRMIFKQFLPFCEMSFQFLDSVF